jgi:ACS family hexuronate transporter-like MFS transporter
VAGIGGAAGAIGGMVMAQYVGAMLERANDYTPIFVISACVYLIALLIIHVLIPRYAMAKIDPGRA